MVTENQQPPGAEATNGEAKPAKVVKTLKISRINFQEGATVGKVFFEGTTKTFKFWGWAQFANDLKVGDEGEAVIEPVENRNSQYPPDDFLTSWKGVTDRKPK